MQWFVSEKLDGIRAYWTGRQLLTRNRNLIHAPAWFTDGLPSEPLEGELWCGYNTLPKCQSIVRRRVPDERWNEITLNLFDAPLLWGRDFRQVYNHLLGLNLPAHVSVVAQRLIPEGPEIDRLYQSIVAKGGEGLVLRAPGTDFYVRKLKRTVERRETRLVVVG